jgi:hypothetical protein
MKSIAWAEGWLACVAAMACTTLGCIQPEPAGTSNRKARIAATTDAARLEMKGFIENVAGAAAKKFGLTDDQGRSMDGAKVLQTDGKFLATYHNNQTAYLASSTDAMNWHSVIALSAAGEATLPVLFQSGASYILAWQSEVSPRHIVLKWFSSPADLYANNSNKQYDAYTPIGGQWCGTPSISSGDFGSVDLSFDYWTGTVERIGYGSVDWTAWIDPAPSPINAALESLGCQGDIGGRDGYNHDGFDFTLVEGQSTAGDLASWRIYNFDPLTNTADQLNLRTPAGSPNAASPHITQININGKDAWLVSAYIHSAGAKGNEAGQLMYYNYLAGNGADGGSVGPSDSGGSGSGGSGSGGSGLDGNDSGGSGSGGSASGGISSKGGATGTGGFVGAGGMVGADGVSATNSVSTDNGVAATGGANVSGGVPGTGGLPGAGGVLGASGAAGAAGGMGGASGSGGAPALGGNSGVGTTKGSAQPGGCSCNTQAGRPTALAMMFLFAILFASWRRRFL